MVLINYNIGFHLETIQRSHTYKMCWYLTEVKKMVVFTTHWQIFNRIYAENTLLYLFKDLLEFVWMQFTIAFNSLSLWNRVSN